jgi:hypothetical protein
MNLAIISAVQRAMTVSKLTVMSALLNEGLDSEMFVAKFRVDPVKKVLRSKQWLAGEL